MTLNMDMPQTHDAYLVYQYVPVQPGEIRTITLLPSRLASAPLIAELRVISLSDRPQPGYEALSYVWGDQRSEECLGIETRQAWDNNISLQPQENDLNQPSVRRCILHLPLKRNLECALRRLRLQHASRHLWIDAICINQVNLTERKEQVEQMGQIYSKASKVLVWLGESTDDTDIVFDIFDQLEQDPHTDRGRDAITKMSEKAIDSFFERPWWTRRWVLQEVALAKEDPVVLCGGRSTYFDNLVSLISCCRYVFDFGLILAHRLHRRTELKSQAYHSRGGAFHDKFGWQEQDLMDLIVSETAQQATDPRDHVYGMLGLTTSWYRDNIKVDYSYSVSQVYQQAMFAAIRKTDSLDCFNLLLNRSRSRPDLPSWTYDFSSAERHTQIIRTPSSVRRVLEWNLDIGRSTHAKRPPSFAHDISRGVLSVNGLVAGKIRMRLSTTTTKSDLLFRRKAHDLPDCISTFHARLGTSISELERLVQTAKQAAAFSSFKLSTEDLYRTIVGGNTAFGTRDTFFDFSIVSRVLDSLFGNTEGGPTLNDSEVALTLLKSDAEKIMFLQYLKDAVLCAYWGSAYFCTDSGMLGLSSRDVRDDDTIALLFGTSLPAVLRWVESADETKKGWQFVSFAYVHSMDDRATLAIDDVVMGRVGSIPQMSDTMETRTFELI